MKKATRTLGCLHAAQNPSANPYLSIQHFAIQHPAIHAKQQDWVQWMKSDQVANFLAMVLLSGILLRFKSPLSSWEGSSLLEPVSISHIIWVRLMTFLDTHGHAMKRATAKMNIHREKENWNSS